MRWKPIEFYSEDTDETIIAVDGCLDEERSLRRLAAFAFAPYTGKDFDITKYWPVAGDDELKEAAEYSKKQILLQKLRKNRLEEQQRKTNGR